MGVFLKHPRPAGAEVGTCDAIEESEAEFTIIVTRPIGYAMQIETFVVCSKRDPSRSHVAGHGTDTRIRTMPEQPLVVEIHELKRADGREFRPCALLDVRPAYYTPLTPEPENPWVR
jgi:hypothetical protein